MSNIDSNLLSSPLIRNIKVYYRNRKCKYIDPKSISNYILYIDGYIGGGNRFFSNCILTYYKKFTNFIIVRKFKGDLIITLNNQYRLNLKTYDDILNFLDIRTKKIFINNIGNHDMNFIEKLCKTKYETSIITHDHYFIYKSGCNILDIDKVNKDEILDITKYNKIFTQNIHNIKYLDNFIPEETKSKFIITELPDYKNKFKKIEFKNNRIKIGIIGIISNVKGGNILKLLFDKFKNKYDFFIFGSSIDYKGISSKIYGNINEFNNLLEREKPNIFLSISNCPETYSYTTTLMNITNLPVLFYKTNNPVVKDRLLKYREFSLNDLNKFEKDLNEIKQDYLYTVEPKIYFNKVWDNYFICNNK